MKRSKDTAGSVPPLDEKNVLIGERFDFQGALIELGQAAIRPAASEAIPYRNATKCGDARELAIPSSAWNREMLLRSEGRELLRSNQISQILLFVRGEPPRLAQGLRD